MSEQQSKPKPQRTTRNIVIAVVAGLFVLALGAGAFIFTSMTVMDGSLRGRERQEMMQRLEADAARTDGVVYVVRDIPKGAAIKMEDLDTRTVTAPNTPHGAVQDPKLAVGRHATVDIAQGENLTEDNLDSPKTAPAKQGGKEAK
ncbi:MAG: SAF domain-containing protein [Candidatus Obscuribacterales bacterium]